MRTAGEVISSQACGRHELRTLAFSKVFSQEMTQSDLDFRNTILTSVHGLEGNQIDSCNYPCQRLWCPEPK